MTDSSSPFIIELGKPARVVSRGALRPVGRVGDA
jgi:hypothetical protein